jgi:hypothetical protein
MTSSCGDKLEGEGVAIPERKWFPHRDYAGEQMPEGVFRDPPDDAPTNPSPKVHPMSFDKQVTMADRHAAAQLAWACGVPDIKGPRQQQEIAEHFAKHRLAALEASSRQEERLSDEAFANAVWDALKGDHNDLRKQAIILRAHRAALERPHSKEQG